ncbi:hypothetical protein V6N13_116222 [Hibiscus sabdariffa]|uniref:Uncharacterized protein n=1 Tax=Hibiscus sabdariffa TaxID=183260 RepID=A0ABR2PBY9_9ROSI
MDGTVVPNSVSLKVDPAKHIDRMWEGNMRDYLRVLGFSSMSRNLSNEEEAGIVNRMDCLPSGDAGVHDVFMKEVEFQEGIGDIASLGGLLDVSSPMERGVVGPKSDCPRVNLAITTVLNNGQEAGDELSLMHRLKSLKFFLWDWNSVSFGDVDRGIINVTKQLDELDNDGEVVMQSQEVRDKRKKLQAQLWKLSRYSESIWRQKSRVTWLK